MSGETGFLDFLRERDERGNDEIIRAIVPLLEQVAAAHDRGRVGPLAGTARLFADGGHLYFRVADELEPKVDLRAVRAVDVPASGGIHVVDRERIDVDLDRAETTRHSSQVGEPGAPIVRPVLLVGYVGWEHELGHHDALTDVFSLGMLLASLATGLDFTEPADLEQFVVARRDLGSFRTGLHPVIARAIVRMTELSRHTRVQDLPSVIARLQRYRDVDEQANVELDFRKLPGFLHGDRSSRRKVVQERLQSRLFEITRRNRLIYFQPTLQSLNLTVGSVPVQLDYDHIGPDELFLWDGAAGQALAKAQPVRLDRYLRFEEAPYIAGVLDTIRAQAERDRAEYGFGQLRLAFAFLNWHNLRDAPDERITSPLLLLPVVLERKRGVRDSYVLVPQSDIAEVNPVLRQFLRQLYDLELPEQIDLGDTDVQTFHKVLQAAVTRSEPGIQVALVTRPQIRLVHERARRRLDAWRRRSQVSGRGIRRQFEVNYSYGRANFQPLGLQLYLHKVRPERMPLAESLAPARLTRTLMAAEPTEEDDDDPAVKKTERHLFTLTEEATGKMNWSVDLCNVTLSNFNYRKMSLVRDYDRMLAAGGDVEHPAFDRLFSLDARELETPPEATGDPFDLFCVVPADGTQAAAIRWARSGKSFIVQGPPGTGKSQTITNLIADFAARGKRVLFVCQKRAALDVVYHRLAQHGLDELSVIIHDSQADKKEFVADLGRTYERWVAPESAAPTEVARDAARSALGEAMEALTRFSESMTGPADGAACSVHAVLREVVAGEVAPALDPTDAERVPDHRSWQAWREPVHLLGRELTELREPPIVSQLAVRWVGREVLTAPAPITALREGLARIRELLGSVLAARSLLHDGATLTDVRTAVSLAEGVRFLAETDDLALLDPGSGRSRDLAAAVEAHAAAVRKLDVARTGTAAWREKLVRADLVPALAQARSFDGRWCSFASLSWWALRGVLTTRYDFAKHAVKPGWTLILEQLSAEYAAEDTIAELDQATGRQFRFTGEIAPFLERVATARSLGATAHERTLVGRWVTERDGAAQVKALLAVSEALGRLLEVVRTVLDGCDGLPLEELDRVVTETAAGADLLPEVQEPLRRLLDAPAEVRAAVRRLPLTPGGWDAAVGRRTLDRTFRTNRPLARFDHAALTRRREVLGEQYGAWLAGNAEAVRGRVRARFVERVRMSESTGAVADKALKKAYNAGRRELEREFKKVMRHRSIREMASGSSGTVVYDLKPIWLMSPLSISDTLPLDEARFDVVIFDEASQIPLEEAVPAVVRAAQMIVVGDEMQLPPTDFFTTARDEETVQLDDDAGGVVEYDLGADSFLTHAAACLASTMLGWHYRSRSEGLIRFSNHAFYGGGLLTVPDRAVPVRREPIVVSAPSDGDTGADAVLDRPVSFHHLTSSPYLNRRNAGEAEYVARLVRGILNRGTGASIGVVAFSEAQQDEIESALERLADQDPAFRTVLDAEREREEDGQLVGLFVKNLENVQGDERDVIVLSVCYGPDDAGKMRMNFGPINKGGGEKRLNVVFSRAKRHMVVVTSIRGSAVTNDYNDGARCLRRYLQYAEAMSVGDDGAAAAIVRTLASDSSVPMVAEAGEVAADGLVDAVAAGLEARGLVVARNLGASRLRCDLAVRRPEDPEFRLAVVVDTADHYATSDRVDRYHTRPAVLGAFGWRVEVVLYKDWVEDPERCLVRLGRALSVGAN